MESLHRLALAVSRAGAIAGGALLLAAATIIGIDVVLRVAFTRTIGGADELSGYALAIASAWGFSFALLHRAHIRIDSLYELWPRTLRAWVDLLCLALTALFMALVTYRAWGVLAQSITSNARSISALSTPLVIPQAFWVAGLVFFMLVLALLILQVGLALLRGDLNQVFRLAGSKAVTEEIQEEIALQEHRP